MTEPAPEPSSIFIERIAPGGSGVGHLPTGEVVFIPGSVPGDRIDVTDIVRRQGALHGKIRQVTVSGPERIASVCPVSEQCGGCDFIQLSETGQRQAKLQILREALNHVGSHVAHDVTIGFVRSDRQLMYRSRARLHVAKDGTVGFLESRSQRVIAVTACPVAEPTINAALATLGEADDRGRRLLSLCTQVELRAAEHEPKLTARLFAAPGIVLDANKFAGLFPANTTIVIAGQADESRVTQQYALPHAISLTATISAFTQVNPSVNTKLVEAIVDVAMRYCARTFVDAYAGAGNFTLPLLAQGLTGDAIDTCAEGIYSARATARDFGWPYTGFHVGDARSVLESLVTAKRTFDLVLLDPPRQGSKDVLAVALRLQPRIMALIACDPVTLARDLKWLAERGATIDSLSIYDMFPQTHHFETLAVVRLGD